MNEDRILQAVERIEGRIDILDKKIDTVNQDLKDFKTETRDNFKAVNERIDTTNEKVDSIGTRLNKFEEETRINFVSINKKMIQSNERIIELDKKVDKGFENTYKAVGTAMSSMMTSVDQNYVKIKNSS